ncbi:MAG: enoyl-CoA hydratase/isomerase family protein [Firmicutes bacterium]|nr:enoyl-CoA hydratase/isomerase family protein [Bacillota bacterium]
MPEKSDAVLLTMHGTLAELTMRATMPQHRLDVRMTNALLDSLDALPEETMHLLLLDAEEADFCGGWADDEAAAALASLHPSPADQLADMAFPTVCAVWGKCEGPGFEMALACDLIWATPDAQFALPAIHDGRFPTWGGTQRLARSAGRAKTLDWLLTGRRISGQEAYESGVVSQLLTTAQPLLEARTKAEMLANQARWALYASKAAVKRSLDLTLQQGLELEADLYALLETTDDRAEGVRAFLEKRSPHFQDR